MVEQYDWFTKILWIHYAVVKEKIRFCSKQDWAKFSLCFSKHLLMQFPFLAPALLLSEKTLKDINCYFSSSAVLYYLSSFLPSAALCLTMYDTSISQINNTMPDRGWMHQKRHNQKQGLLLCPTDAAVKRNISDLATVLTSTQLLLMYYIKQELEH